MRIDGGLPSVLARVPATAAALERQGYDGAWCGEVNHDPFLPLVLAAEHTSRLEIGTCIAVAFARNPMSVAQLGWDLQSYSGGRFVLGLGSQVRPHIEKRFGMPWGQPVSRMREFILALRAIWTSWQDGTPLRFEGEFFTHTLMTPTFVPEPHAYGQPRVFVAAVGTAMTRMCGEVADGMHTHAFTTRRYLQEVTLPALADGLTRAGRGRGDIQVCYPAFVATGRTAAEVEVTADAMRQRIAFYGSTPAYRGVLDLHGWGELQTELRALSLRGEWAAMGKLIDDEVLDAFAVVGPLDTLADRVRERFEGVVDRLMFSLPEGTPAETVAAVLEAVRGPRAG
ncbi:LLM class F420-dependent oxidoreductase [Frankia sp. AgB1.9]|uniref:LLM class F420-dependent oxidoreductase n=1 Tax=unclassified Frankia TaxID=2632575 RepID=UPI00193282AE|nr:MULTISPECIES: LLM class F420-dependent oxidoreductase [unclassified Frankia]MBL7492566.1 LLM class F420-dependent oxidoreductase [Frankia sp. AgW1.1]MBL7548719.1 LLM class F420-dependent oxidoreductase [Frankia sp. AgB1.9]MBL7619317.1 LLM class F420-dependent oxidoreductase [Frankia sp. AgB1.8]